MCQQFKTYILVCLIIWYTPSKGNILCPVCITDMLLVIELKCKIYANKSMFSGKNARTTPPLAMLFADDLVLVSETAEEVEEELERWRAIIENKGLIISRSKTEYLAP